LKILVVHNTYQQPGGEDIVFQQECRLLQAAGHDVVTYLRSNDEVKQYSGVRQLALIPHTIWSTEARREFTEIFVRERPQIVHVHNTFIMISPSIYSVCAKANTPVVHTLHNYRLFCPAGTFYRHGHVCEECAEHTLWRSVRYGCYRGSRAATSTVAAMLVVHRVLKTWNHSSHFYIALTEFARSKFVRGGLPPERIFVKPNFVEPDPGVPDEKGNYTVFIGRLSPEKRVSTLLNAWKLLSEPFPLLILGGGPERAFLQELARSQNLDGVSFRGHLPREQVIAILRKARFLIFSSEWYENFPVTIAEAFACATPVIASRMGAMQEIIEDGRTGLHFQPGDSQDLAKKIAWAWSHPKEMAVIGRAARREYETKYSSQQNYAQLMNIYEQVLASTGRRLNT